MFQYLSNRPPFDDVALREEFRRRLNQIPGVDIAAARLALRPGFPLTMLTAPGVRDVLLEHLGWFARQVGNAGRTETSDAAVRPDGISVGV